MEGFIAGKTSTHVCLEEDDTFSNLTECPPDQRHVTKKTGLRRRDEARIDKTRKDSYHVRCGMVFAYHDK
jgi:hypothetical protein